MTDRTTDSTSPGSTSPSPSQGPPPGYVSDVKPHTEKVVIEEYDPSWPEQFRAEEELIRTALGERALRVEHTGSTSVPGLPAKPVIDITLLVPDSADEDTYLPQLEAHGYTLRVREPDWYEHRCLATRTAQGAHRNVNLHVFSPQRGAPEIARMLLFRDWLRTHPEDRDLYAATKKRLAARDWSYVQEYADAKTEIVEQILTRAAGSPE
ncbi:GrpB family protein [Streptomyces monticola]|uniref:GrpB family protein n=1 Tax=Streptomyces monticola TaxID=2666263 RepID=A0ABW2JKC0_9ACTN